MYRGVPITFIAEALPDQKLRSWIGTHVRMFEFFGTVPQIAVCNNLKLAVTRHREKIQESTKPDWILCAGTTPIIYLDKNSVRTSRLARGASVNLTSIRLHSQSIRASCKTLSLEGFCSPDCIQEHFLHGLLVFQELLRIRFSPLWTFSVDAISPWIKYLFGDQVVGSTNFGTDPLFGPFECKIFSRALQRP